MAYIFLDESGDLGFKKRSSQWFLFAIAVTRDSRSLERVIKKVWKQLRAKHKTLGEFHASREKDSTRKRVLKFLDEIEDLKILCVLLDKKRVHIGLQEQKNILYLFAANDLLTQLLSKKIIPADDVIHLYIDQRDTKKQIKERFIKHLTSSVAKKHVGIFSVELHSSHVNKSLQAVDFIAWAIFQKYERRDTIYYEIIKDKIISEKLLYPD